MMLSGTVIPVLFPLAVKVVSKVAVLGSVEVIIFLDDDMGRGEANTIVRPRGGAISAAREHPLIDMTVRNAACECVTAGGYGGDDANVQERDGGRHDP